VLGALDQPRQHASVDRSPFAAFPAAIFERPHQVTGVFERRTTAVGDTRAAGRPSPRNNERLAALRAHELVFGNGMEFAAVVEAVVVSPVVQGIVAAMRLAAATGIHLLAIFEVQRGAG
jgi:hypothetical protein